MPPLKVDEAGMVWILLLEGRWKMSTWWGLGLRKESWRTGRGKRRQGERRTVSELMVFGTAMSSSSEPSSCDGRAVCANEQKFIVFTSRI